MKQCSKCGEEKTFSEFTKRKLSADGLDYWCKTCKSLYEKAKCFTPNYIGTKKCKACNTIKSKKEFYKDRRKADGLEGRCSDCCKDRTRNNEMIKNYGISQQEYEAILKKQNNGCAICGSLKPDLRSKRLNIDHCHKTGKVRGLLCNNCNNGLGRFKDNVVLLKHAINYLLGE